MEGDEEKETRRRRRGEGETECFIIGFHSTFGIENIFHL